ncbi:MAG: CueP family metal-binding protein [Propionicimonas sp.]
MTFITLKKLPAQLIAATAIAAVTLTGCAPAPAAPPSSAPVSSPSTDDLLAAHGLTGLDARQIIDKLDATPLADRPTDLMASVRPAELILSDDQQREATLPIPDGQFYLSFAPYLSQTHDCHFHSLTTCVGELQNTDVQVKVTDAAGDVLVDEGLRTFDNGFLGVWLPRGVDATLTVTHDGHTASTPITTKGDQAATCLTTLQLS